MSKEYFTDNINDVNLAKITDKMLNFEKNQKSRKIINLNLLKIIPAAAAVVLIIGAMNILPGILKNPVVSPDNDNGANVNAASAGISPSTDIDMFVPGTSVSGGVDMDDFVAELTKDIEMYKDFGVSVDKEKGLIMYEGHPVREIWDHVTGMVITESIDPIGFGGRNVTGAIDLTPVYENGIVTGMKKSTQEEYDKRTEERRLNVAEMTSINGENPLDIALHNARVALCGEDYVTKQYGRLIITTPKGQDPLDNGDGTVTLPAGGEVLETTGNKIGWSLAEGAVVDYENDKIISVGGMSSVAKRIELPDGSSFGAGVSGGVDMDEFVAEMTKAIEIYKDFGVSIDKENGLIMYEGHPVREIWDRVTGVIITESIGPDGFGGIDVTGAIDLTPVYENGVITGLKKSTQEEYDKRTEERRLNTAETTS